MLPGLQEIERLHCCYSGQRRAGVARGAQVENNVTGAKSLRLKKGILRTLDDSTCRNRLCLLVLHLLTLYSNRPQEGKNRTADVSLCLGHPKCRGDW